jgi:hypothetical protein
MHAHLNRPANTPSSNLRPHARRFWFEALLKTRYACLRSERP